MYAELRHTPQEDTMLNASMTSQIPKRTHIDTRWFKNIGNPDIDQSELTNGEFLAPHAGLPYYLVLACFSLLITGTFVLVYIKCCMYALKGNLDLPAPGGGTMPSPRFYWRNPLKKMANKLRYGNQNKAVEHHPPNPAPTCTLANTFTKANTPASGVNQIPSISSTSPDHHQPSGTASAANTVFESSKASSGVCESFRQFRQFQHDRLEDEVLSIQQEEVVFDVLDLQK